MRIRHSRFLYSNVSLPTLMFQLLPLTARQLANVLALAYAGLGLMHLNNKVGVSK